MKLTKYIEELNKFLKEHGDLECYYSSDDEGNRYQKVDCCGTRMWVSDLEEYMPDMIEEEYLINYEEDDECPIPVCVVN